MKFVQGTAVPERLGMGPKNAEIFVEDGIAFVRMYLEKTSWYVTYRLVVNNAIELERELREAETEESN